MLTSDSLKDLLSNDLSDQDKLLICLAVEPGKSRAVKEIIGLAISSGWRQVRKKNVSQILSRASTFAVRTDSGWELTSAGLQHVSTLAGPLMGSPVPTVASALRAQLAKISDEDTRLFVAEAIACFETRQHRAAVVLSWIGAVSVMQSYVINNRLIDFNNEASRRIGNWKTAKTADDIGLMKEDTFLDVLQSLSIIGKNVKQELKACLTLRNGCGHPNSLKIAEHKVASHIEVLILNVFGVF